jgi:exodeoxyribonuclease VII small subunit
MEKMEKFEDLLNELNVVVKELESGTLSLEESIQKYEKGIELSKKCKDKLLAAKEVVIAKTADKEEK